MRILPLLSSPAIVFCSFEFFTTVVVSGKVLRLCTRQCSIACSEANASSSSLLVIIHFQHLVSFFFSFVLQVSLSLGVVPSRVEFFPPASLLMSPSCLLTQHVTRGAASLAGCICICMQVRVGCSVALALLGLWGALRPGPGPGGARCEPNQAGVGRGCASLLCGFRGHPLFVIQRAPRAPCCSVWWG